MRFRGHKAHLRFRSLVGYGYVKQAGRSAENPAPSVVGVAKAPLCTIHLHSTHIQKWLSRDKNPERVSILNIRTNLYVLVGVYIGMYVHISKYVHACIHVCLHLHVNLYTYIETHMDICLNVYIHAHIAYVNLHIYIYIYIYLYIHIHTHVFTLLLLIYVRYTDLLDKAYIYICVNGYIYIYVQCGESFSAHYLSLTHAYRYTKLNTY